MPQKINDIVMKAVAPDVLRHRLVLSPEEEFAMTVGELPPAAEAEA